MARSTLIMAGKEHPNSCDGWRKLCNERKISYVWYACDCSMMERSYEILNERGEWESIKNCPFCGIIIGYDFSRYQIQKITEKTKCPKCGYEFVFVLGGN